MSQKLIPPRGPGDPDLPPGHDWRILVCHHCGHSIKVLVACKDRFCPDCAPRRAARVRRRLTWLINKTPKKTGFGIKMITLSTPNCTDLDAGVKHLIKSFRRLRNRLVWNKYVEGGAFVIEVTGRPGSWHPHIHAIVYSLWFPWRSLHKAWKQCSGGTAVFVQSMSKEAAARYVTKYLTKTQVPPHLHEALSDKLRGTRLFQRFGLWHHLKLPKKLYDHKCEECGRSSWGPDLYSDRMIRYYEKRFG